MFEGKLKFSTFIHRGVPVSDRATPGFRAALMFLPELYAAALCPRPSSELPEPPTEDRWRLVCAGYGANNQLREALGFSNRVEMSVRPGTGDYYLLGTITFYRGTRRFGFHIEFSVPLQSEWISAQCKW